MNRDEILAALANTQTSAERKAQGAGPWDEYADLALDSLIAEARFTTVAAGIGCSICGVPPATHNDEACRLEYEDGAAIDDAEENPRWETIDRYKW